ncbi:MAG: DUF3052 domain-containing protein [Alphaproteobacteria bacterium]|nr:DUF3052 domain-containing protein [Alphaproteobacteria bacterium]
MTGYSGTPLAKKLTLKDGFRVFWLDMPASVREEIATQKLDLVNVGRTDEMDAAHLFVTEAALLRELLTGLRGTIAQNGMIWVSWPKKASKRPTDITEDVIRAIALPMGLVDIKVCAVDAVWSGLKLVIRKELRI